MGKKWHYADTKTSQHGTMICTHCLKSIEDGEYRYRETQDAFLSQHRNCSAGDPVWQLLDAQREAREVFNARREKAARAFVAEWGGEWRA